MAQDHYSKYIGYRGEVRDFFRKIWPFVEKEFYNPTSDKITVYKGFVIGYEHPYFKVSILNVMHLYNKYRTVYFFISFLIRFATRTETRRI